MENTKTTFKTKRDQNSPAVETTTEIMWDCTDEQIVELAVGALVVKAQAKWRSGKLEFGPKLLASEVLAKTTRANAAVTPQKAATVISEMQPEERVRVMLNDMGLPPDSVQAYLDHQLEQGKITEDQHEKCCDIITMN